MTGPAATAKPFKRAFGLLARGDQQKHIETMSDDRTAADLAITQPPGPAVTQ